MTQNYVCIVFVIKCNEASEVTLKEGSLICYFDEKRILKRFPLSSCQYVSTIPKKLYVQLHVHVTDLLTTWTFCKGLYGENDGPSI